jgi:molecular chaperone DnaK (HSP70)
MRLGIDFGTTRTVVAAVDRGNYPLVAFANDGNDADSSEWIPSRWNGERSFKRRLGRARLGDSAFETTALFLTDLERAIRSRSNLRVEAGEPLEAVIGVPANASSTQRFLTAEAFRAAGFQVLAVVNEPSAAGLEFAHRHRKSITSVREHVLVYDLGGGTFDASLIDMGDRDHRVLSSAGLADLGGDDFDRVIADLVIERAKLGASSAERDAALLVECCLKKESIVPQTRRIVIDLQAAGIEADPVVLAVDDVYERCAPLVERTMSVLLEPLAGHSEQVDLDTVAGIYVVGGGASLPIVARLLREKFGRRVHRSPYSFAATAIGLAIAADASSGYELSDCFTRHFGVWREAEAGTRAAFDPIFAKDTPLPPAGSPPIARVRRYRARHDVGHFRFLECSHLEPSSGTPAGDLMLRHEVLFPFDPALRDVPALDRVNVKSVANGPWVEERYECGPDGIVKLVLTAEDGFQKSYCLTG